jgi:ABC-type spermidine/putrescine transport system permease subunit I
LLLKIHESGEEKMKKLYLQIMLLIGFVVFTVLLYLCNTMVEPISSLETKAKFTPGDVTTMLSNIKDISNAKNIIFSVSLLGAITCIILLIISYTFPWLKSQKKKETKIKKPSINKNKKK